MTIINHDPFLNVRITFNGTEWVADGDYGPETRFFLRATEHDVFAYAQTNDGVDVFDTHTLGGLWEGVLYTANSLEKREIAACTTFTDRAAFNPAIQAEYRRIIRLVEASGYDGAGREGFAVGTFARANAEYRFENPDVFKPLANAPAKDWAAWELRRNPGRRLSKTPGFLAQGATTIVPEPQAKYSGLTPAQQAQRAKRRAACKASYARRFGRVSP